MHALNVSVTGRHGSHGAVVLILHHRMALLRTERLDDPR